MTQRVWLICGCLLALILLASVWLLFVPVMQYDDAYCFHCGRTTHTVRICGMPVRRVEREDWLYDDDLVVPPHDHVYVGLAGGQRWLLGYVENWDEFGWTGEGFRGHLLRALARHSEDRQEILCDYLAVGPHDRQAWESFIAKYGTALASQPAVESLPHDRAAIEE